jgi:hypothetical protein
MHLGPVIPSGRLVQGGDGRPETVFHCQADIFSEDHPQSAGNFTYLERMVKFLLWSRGGFRIYFSGPDSLGVALQKHYRETSTGRFDAAIMGDRIYERPFEVAIVRPEEIPPPRANTTPAGRHFNNCRIGFILGGSDRSGRRSDGKCVFSQEVAGTLCPKRPVMAFIRLLIR